jgi:hypothetical protein
MQVDFDQIRTIENPAGGVQPEPQACKRKTLCAHVEVQARSALREDTPSSRRI